MKIGILTYHHVINEGAVLQAISLSQAVKRIYPEAEVEIIDYRPKSVEKAYFYRAIKPEYLLSVPHTLSRYVRFRKFINSSLMLSKLSLVTNDYKKTVKFIKEMNYDLIIVGSDEVWKIDRTNNMREFPNIYWLEDKEISSKRISFAASGNRTQYKRLTLSETDFINKAISKYERISVRDKHTYDMLSYVRDEKIKDLKIIPDPTFMLDIEDVQVKKKLMRYGINCDERQSIAIMVQDSTLNRELCIQLKKKYHVVGMSFYSKNAHVNLCSILDPMEWASALKYFKACITDRFHGTIFCLKNRTPFVSIDSDHDYSGYESKVNSLLKSFNCLEYYVKAYQKKVCVKQVEKIMNDCITNINWEQIDVLLNSNNECCKSFLFDSVKNF